VGKDRRDFGSVREKGPWGGEIKFEGRWGYEVRIKTNKPIKK